MLRRLLAVSALGLVGALAAGGCASSVSPAVRVNGVAVSDRELLDEVGEWARNSQAVSPAQLAAQPSGTFPQQLVGGIIAQRVQLELTHAQFEELELRLNADDRTQAIAALGQGDAQAGQQLLDGFGKRYRQELLDEVAEFLAVQATMGPAFDSWLSQAYDAADVDVSPKYGTWDKTTGQIAPPSGPSQPASASVDLTS